MPEARYAYYRRCQIFRRGGKQCKAPAEKGSQICHAHAGQLAMAVRRERERQAVLAEAVAEMRRQGRPECEMANLFTDFKGIQVTLAVMAQALIDGRIDCKTAGRLVVHLQTMSKLLWMVYRKNKSTTEARRHRGKTGSPQICAEERRLSTAHTVPALKRHVLKDVFAAINGRSSTETLTRPDGPLFQHESNSRLSSKREQAGLRVAQTALPFAIARDTHAEDLRVVFDAKVRTFPESRAGCRDGPGQTLAA